MSDLTPAYDTYTRLARRAAQVRIDRSPLTTLAALIAHERAAGAADACRRLGLADMGRHRDEHLREAKRLYRQIEVYLTTAGTQASADQ